ncbi:MAG: hypothetical protein ACOX1T_03505 [Saccharofermentanales bacterium]
MQMRKIQHEALLREWQEIITTCRNSGTLCQRLVPPEQCEGVALLLLAESTEK